MKEKVCPKCNKNKSLTEFYKSTKSSSYCKSCIVLSNKERQRKTKKQARKIVMTLQEQ